MNTTYSVLMSVYYKENPDFLRDSVDSMIKQSWPPSEIVLVKDGPLTDELELVINDLQSCGIIKIKTLEENRGLGVALNVGLSECKHDIVARMDTDDISIPDRCEKQLKMFIDNPSLSVVGSAVSEFIGEPENLISYKNVFTDHNQIARKMKFRNPMNHPSVMFRKADVIDAGGYKDFFLNEDYFLWIRMLQRGFIFANINEVLVKMRTTQDTYLRRGGWKYFKTQKSLFEYLLRKGLINHFEYFYNNAIRFLVRVILPNHLRKLLYKNILRSRRAKYD